MRVPVGVVKKTADGGAFRIPLCSVHALFVVSSTPLAGTALLPSGDNWSSWDPGAAAVRPAGSAVAGRGAEYLFFGE